MVVKPRKHVAFFEEIDGWSGRIDETNEDTQASWYCVGQTGAGLIGKRADIKAGVGDTGGAGIDGRRGGFIGLLFLSRQRRDQAGEEEHMEGNLAKGVHG